MLGGSSHPLWGLLALATGACWGSFLNVFILRFPSGRSILGRSRCPLCQRVISWYDNIPVLSALLLKGRCRHCQERFGFRYALVEIIVSLLFLEAWSQSPNNLALMFVLWGFISIMVAATFIDLDTLTLPDCLTVGGAILGLACCALVPQLHLSDSSYASFSKGFLGLLLGSGLLFWIAILAESILGKEALGMGDVILMGAVGAFCGWQGAFFALGGGSIVAMVVIVPLFLFRLLGKKDTQALRRVAFGPWIAIGALLYTFLLRNPVNHFFKNLLESLDTILGA